MGPQEDPCADECDDTALSACLGSCGNTPDVCAAPGGACNADMVTYQGCIVACEAALAPETTDPADDDDYVDPSGECAACSAEEYATNECVVEQCLSPCMANSESANCYECVADKCGSAYEDLVNCYIDECATGTDDVLMINYYCGSNCNGDCAPVAAVILDFDTCYNDKLDGKGQMLVCNSDGATITYTEYDSLNCAGTGTDTALTNGECDGMVKEEWFGGCGGAAEWDGGIFHGSTSALFTAFAFVLSAMLF